MPSRARNYRFSVTHTRRSTCAPRPIWAHQHRGTSGSLVGFAWWERGSGREADARQSADAQTTHDDRQLHEYDLNHARLYVCVCTCVCVSLYARKRVCVHVSMYACIYIVRMRACMHTNMYACMYVCMPACIVSVYTCACMYVCLSMYVSMYVCMWNTYKNTHAHTHTQTCRP